MHKRKMKLNFSHRPARRYCGAFFVRIGGVPKAF